MMEKDKKTNVCRILDSAGISYTEHSYDVSDDAIDGNSVARKLGQDPEQVFKTLVTVGNDGNHYVFVVPVNGKLDLKAAAKSVGVKSVEMIPQKELLKTTGYIHGGCSPIGMKKTFPTVLDETVVLFDTIMVSAGKVGKQVQLAPDDLITLIHASYAPIAKED